MHRLAPAGVIPHNTNNTASPANDTNLIRMGFISTQAYR
jgi:hypothetical protein